nr:hypothetical protein [uncultured Butyrivibrio sp.]
MNICTEDVELLENMLFFFSYKHNGLFCADLENNTVKKVCTIENEKYRVQRLYASIVCANAKLFLIPFFASEIAVYDIRTGEQEKIGLPEHYYFSGKPKFMPARAVGDYVYIFSLFFPEIYRINIHTNELKMICDWRVPPNNNFVFNPSDAFFRQQTVFLENTIYIPYCNANAILSYNLINNKSEIISLGSEKNGYSGVCFDKGRLICSPRTGSSKIAIYDLKSGTVDFSEVEKHFYVGVGIKNNNIWLYDEAKYLFIKKIDNKWIYYNKISNTICIWDKDRKVEVVTKYSYDLEDAKLFLENGIAYENNDLQLKMMIECISE